MLVLASQSPTRAALLRQAGIPFESRPARIDEAAIKAAAHAEGAAPGDTALHLANLKAARIREPGAFILAADQLLVCEGRWFDKPTSRNEACAQLQSLRDRQHTLETALVLHQNGQEIWRHLARPRLTMRSFSDAFLETYLAAEGDVLLATVGAYRLEGPGIQLFARIDGDHAAILGLPLLPLLPVLRDHGLLLA